MVLSTPFPPEEGIGNYVYNLSKKLSSNKNNVTIITRGNIYHKTVNLDDVAVEFLPYLPVYPFHVHLHGFFLNNFLNKKNKEFDILHLHTPLTPNISVNIPIISTIHTSLVQDAKHIKIRDLKSLSTKIMTPLISYNLVKNLISKSIIVTTVSKSVSEEISEYYDFEGSYVVGNGVDIKLFKPAYSRDDYALFVGRLDYRKGIYDLMDAINILKEYDDLKFRIIGKGPLYNYIINFIKNHGLNNKAEVLGFVDKDKLIELYQRAKFVILPSHYEGLPTTLLEAMSCGTPVIATAIGGNLDVIENNKNGILVPPNSPETLAREIIHLNENDEYRIVIGKNARYSIEQKYDWEIITNTFIKYYEMCIQ